MKRSPVQGILAAVILATVSLLTNLQSPEDLSVVDVQPLLVTRLVLSYLTNGAVWALLLIFAGWSWGRRWWQAALWAIVCGELALAVHYLLGWAIGFFDWSDVSSNLYWFVAALGDGLLLGVAGWVMRRADGWGFAASLLVPGGAHRRASDESATRSGLVEAIRRGGAQDCRVDRARDRGGAAAAGAPHLAVRRATPW